MILNTCFRFSISLTNLTYFTHYYSFIYLLFKVRFIISIGTKYFYWLFFRNRQNIKWTCDLVFPFVSLIITLSHTTFLISCSNGFDHNYIFQRNNRKKDIDTSYINVLLLTKIKNRIYPSTTRNIELFRELN